MRTDESDSSTLLSGFRVRLGWVVVQAGMGWGCGSEVPMI